MPTGLLLEGKKERPPLMPPPFYHFLFLSFLMSPSVLSGFRDLWQQAVIEEEGTVG